MQTTTVLETKELTLWFHEEAKIVHHELHRYPGASTLEAALERGLSVLRERAAHKWLSDDRKGGALDPAGGIDRAPKHLLGGAVLPRLVGRKAHRPPRTTTGVIRPPGRSLSM